MSNPLNAVLSRALYFQRKYGWSALLLRVVRIDRWIPNLVIEWRQAQPMVSGARPARINPLPFGVNLIGYIEGGKGLGEATRLAAEALRLADVPVAEVQVRREPGLYSKLPYRFNLVVTLFDRADDQGWPTPHDLKDYYSISYCPWDNEVFPEGFGLKLLGFDEVWVPSEFDLRAVTRIARVPVLKVPHPIPSRVISQAERSPFLEGIPPEATVFLFVFHVSSNHWGRKNPEGIVEAFKRAFEPHENAWLVIKATPETGRATLRPDCDIGGANIRLLECEMSREDLDDLMRSCDCYVSLHRVEGFGLTMAEAMMLAKPVIATNYSGNTDFMTHENSYLVDYELLRISETQSRSHNGWPWAEPDLNQAAALMREVHVSPARARTIGRRARLDVQKTLSLEIVAKMMKQRLLALSGNDAVQGPSSPDQTTESSFRA